MTQAFRIFGLGLIGQVGIASIIGVCTGILLKLTGFRAGALLCAQISDTLFSLVQMVFSPLLFFTSIRWGLCFQYMLSFQGKIPKQAIIGFIVLLGGIGFLGALAMQGLSIAHRFFNPTGYLVFDQGFTLMPLNPAKAFVQEQYFQISMFGLFLGGVLSKMKRGFQIHYAFFKKRKIDLEEAICSENDAFAYVHRFSGELLFSQEIRLPLREQEDLQNAMITKTEAFCYVKSRFRGIHEEEEEAMRQWNCINNLENLMQGIENILGQMIVLVLRLWPVIFMAGISFYFSV